MHIDAWLKGNFSYVVCALLATMAYFQARVLSAVVGIELAGGIAAPEPVQERREALVAAPEHATNAGPILARNPFDSATGPLSRSAKADSAVAQASPSAQGAPCRFGRAVFIAVSDDDAWSFAEVAPAGGKSTLVRVGGEVAGHEVKAIRWDRLLFGEGDSVCEMVLGAHPEPPKAAPAPSDGAPAPRRPTGALPPEIAARIHRISDTEFTIDRSAVQAIMERQAELLGRVRVMPERDGDKITGVKLSGVRPDSLLAALGMDNGDSLQKVNGFDVADPHAALEAYAKLQTADRFSLALVRGGKPMTIDLRLQ